MMKYFDIMLLYFYFVSVFLLLAEVQYDSCV